MSKKVALFLANVGRGGVGRNMISLAHGLQGKGCEVELWVGRLNAEERRLIPDSLPFRVLPKSLPIISRLLLLVTTWRNLRVTFLPLVIPFSGARASAYLHGLIACMDSEKPDVVYSAKPHANIINVIARDASKHKPKVFLYERTATARDAASRRGYLRWRLLIPCLATYYSKADKVIAVSEGVEAGLHECTSGFHSTVAIDSCTIYHPINFDKIQEKAKFLPKHKWFQDRQVPNLVAVGRLQKQKDYDTMLEAVALVNVRKPVNLTILGSGSLKESILKKAEELQIGQAVNLQGHVDNPFSFVRHADLFVLSSRWEGLPTVLIEALFCGAKIVSTDCPYGAKEILANGQLGCLAPVADSEALAQGILDMLSQTVPPGSVKLREEIINKFNVDYVLQQHLDLMI
ncbi:MAG: glycosyltransferase [Gammaproteobacteria bacterium]|nr:glycosyltransferase [Gammaproteobacteria bacterium]